VSAKVLVADDEPPIVRAVAANLPARGYDLVTADRPRVIKADDVAIDPDAKLVTKSGSQVRLTRWLQQSRVVAPPEDKGGT
jgi:CheY-like chemotaxis protein